MSMTGQPPVEQFRVSQLLYDTRYRSYTIQIFALVAIMNDSLNQTLMVSAVLSHPVA